MAILTQYIWSQWVQWGSIYYLCSIHNSVFPDFMSTETQSRTLSSQAYAPEGQTMNTVAVSLGSGVRLSLSPCLLLSCAVDLGPVAPLLCAYISSPTTSVFYRTVVMTTYTNTYRLFNWYLKKVNVHLHFLFVLI